MRGDGEAALARRHLPGEGAQHRRQDLTGEDDRLLMCLLTEFGDTSPTLVAEVFSSIRRLDGVHMDRNIVVARVRTAAVLYFCSPVSFRLSLVVVAWYRWRYVVFPGCFGSKCGVGYAACAGAHGLMHMFWMNGWVGMSRN